MGKDNGGQLGEEFKVLITWTSIWCHEQFACHWHWHLFVMVVWEMGGAWGDQERTAKGLENHKCPN